MADEQGSGVVVTRRTVRAGPGASPEFAVIRCVDWLRARGLEVNQELWDGIYEIAQSAKRPSVRLRARQMLVDRIDPLPRPPALEINTGDVSLTWGPQSPSPTPHEPTSKLSTTPSNGIALGPASSSVTDALENL